MVVVSVNFKRTYIGRIEVRLEKIWWKTKMRSEYPSGGIKKNPGLFPVYRG